MSTFPSGGPSFPWTGAHDRGPIDWSWADALAAAVPGRRYRVVHILFSMVRERCRELGCVEGADLTCTHSDHGTVGFVADDGPPARLEREYAWFVQVECVEPADGDLH